MENARLRSLAALALVLLAAEALEQTFISVLFDRSPDHGPSEVLWAVGLMLPAAVLVLGALVRHWAPVAAAVRAGEAATADQRQAARRRLSRLPFFLAGWCLGLFPLVNLVVLAVRASQGDPFPGALDLSLILSLSLAFGFMAALQAHSLIEAQTLPVRRSLGLTSVAAGQADLGLAPRIFLVNLGSVALAGLLASMAAIGFYREVVAYYTNLAADGVTAATSVSTEAVSENELKVVVQLGLLFAAVLAWAVALTTTALANLSRQLRDLTRRVEEMAGGAADLGRRAEVLYFDEVGLLTGKINALMERLQGVVSTIGSTAAQVLASARTVNEASHLSEGRLEAVMAARREAEGALGGQGEALDSTLVVAQDLEDSSSAVEAAAEDQIQAVSRGAGAMEEMARSVASVREMTVRADGLAGSLRSTSDQGAASVGAVRQAMDSIQKAAEAVSGTLATIKKTASQTNLLAMNAAIEAAHAGSSGLGFAVVASEVRKLAEDSSRGAKTISDLMKDMEAKIGEGDRLARAAGEAFERIYGLVVQTSEVMGTVARAMDEQQSGTDTVLASTRTLRDAASKIGEVTGKQTVHAEALNRSVQILVTTGASLAMAQDVQGRALEDLTNLVRTVAHEAQGNAQAAEDLRAAVSGFLVGGRP